MRVHGRRSRVVAVGVLLSLALGWGQMAAVAEAASASDPPGVGSPPALRDTPTDACPQPALDELNETIAFVRGKTWTDQPGRHSLALAPDLTTCRVVLHIGQLSDAEEAALQAGAGSRLAIEYRRDWAKPSRLLLILWVVLGSSGVIWVYRRYGRTRG